MRLLVITVVLAVGCGGPKYEGHWFGTWQAVTNAGQSSSGTFTVWIKRGVITGSCTGAAQPSAMCDATGEVDSAGHGTLVFTTPGVATNRAECTSRELGTHVIGDCNLVLGGTTYGGLSFDMYEID